VSEQLLFPDAVMTEEEKKERVLLQTKRQWAKYSQAHRDELNAKGRARYAENREQEVARNKAYYARNKQRMLDINKKWKKEHPVYAAQIARNWRVNHPDESKKLAREKRLRNPEASREVGRRWRRRHKAKALVNSARERNKTKKLPFDLHDHIDEIQKRIDTGHCELTGIPLNLAATPASNYNAVSIDRVVPQLGYVYSNIRIVAFAVNCMMGNWGEDVALSIFASWTQQKKAREEKPCATM